MIDLISIHIPKTAGRSFLNILNSVYVPESIAHFENKNYSHNSISPVDQFKSQLNNSINVIHGHFKFKEIEDLKKKDSTKVITWLRNPIERVISNYSFFKKRITLAPDDAELQLRKNETILDYARMEESKNRMSKFIHGLEIDDFFFIGITENFNSDIDELGKKLNWKTFTTPRINDNSYYKSGLPTISSETRKIIADLNSLDIELYQMVLNKKTI